MWELDYKESWALKNWCFWTVVLEKTLESPLDCKEIQPVHLKGDPECSLEGLILRLKLWPPDAKSWLIWKDPDAGKDWRREEKGTTDGWMASPTQWTWVWVDSGSWWWTGGPSVLWFMGLQRVGHNWVNEMNWYLKLKTNKDLLYTTGNSGPTVYHKDLCSIFCNNLNGKRIWEKNRYRYMCKWISLLYTWN